jgi:hypothetical protein
VKLRFRNNSLRLRVNQREVQTLASGLAITEEILFPGNARMTYTLQASPDHSPQARYEGGNISVLAPGELLHDWAGGDQIGLYFRVPADTTVLAIAIEKDLECVDGSPEERDPEAFPRAAEKAC